MTVTSWLHVYVTRKGTEEITPCEKKAWTLVNEKRMLSRILLSASRRPVATAAVCRNLATSSFKQEDPPFVVTKPGIKSKLIDGKLLAAEVGREIHVSWSLPQHSDWI